jgi:DNA (cytosine-5)-methyltransferase 1
MNELSLFTGAGGGLLGSILLGWHPIGYVEWDDYCQRVIAARIKDGILPDAPIFGNIKTFISDGYAASYQGLVDVITGGFPCQDISCAGSGKGLNGERSGLWKEMAEVVRQVKPRYVFVENSPMLTIRGLGTVLRDLASMGYDARWGVLSAKDIGADHERKRIWILAYTDKKLGGWSGRGIGCSKKTLWHIRHTQKGKEYMEKPESVVCGNNNVVAHRVDRLKAIGNGQVPQCMATAFRILTGQIQGLL